jgi:hypothetical protein
MRDATKTISSAGDTPREDSVALFLVYEQRMRSLVSSLLSYGPVPFVPMSFIRTALRVLDWIGVHHEEGDFLAKQIILIYSLHSVP